MQISAIVLTYNSSFTSVRSTLKSLILQKNVKFEIIIADDFSSEDISELILNYFNSMSFTNFKFVNQSENVGTVKNLLFACEHAKGQYIKPIGAGDLLFHDQTLFDICQFMDKNESNLTFGLLKSFSIIDNDIKYNKFCPPTKKSAYLRNDFKTTVVNIVCFNDWISGASMFYDRKYLVESLNTLKKSVIYCEDLIQVISLLNLEIVHFYNDYVVWYEYGHGISTSPDTNGGLDRIKKDHQSFFAQINQDFKGNHLLKIKSDFEKIKALKLPNFIKKLMLLFFKTYHTNIHNTVIDRGIMNVKSVDNQGFLSDANVKRFIID
jgi:glycosyltransferase involved in cell wall biosynthesis